MFEQIGLGAEFSFRNVGLNDMLSAIHGMNDLHQSALQGTASVNELQEQMGRFTNTLKTGGTKMFLEGMAISAANAGGIMKAAKFESTFSELTKYMSDTSEQGIRSFNEALSDTSKYLGQNKEDVMGAVQSYLTMGLAQEEAIKMVRTAGYAGKIWEVLPQEAASSFKAVAAAYKLNFLDDKVTDDFIDKVNSVGDSTSATASELLNFVSSAGAGLLTIGNVGMDGALAMASAARKAEVDITHLGYGMRQITKVYAEKGEGLFGAIGIDIKDAEGNLIPFNDALGMASEKMGDLSEEQQRVFAMGLGQRYSDDLLRMMGAWDEYDKAMGIASDPSKYMGSASAEWEKITNTFAHNFNKTKLILSDFIISTFGSLLPYLTKGLSVVNKALEGVVNWFNKHPRIKTFVAALSVLTGVLLVVGGAIAITMATLMSFLGSIPAGVSVMSLLTGAMSGFKLSIMSVLPQLKLIGMKVLGLAVAFGAIYLAWKYDLLGIRSMLENFVGATRDAMANAKDIMGMGAKDMAKSFDELANSNSLVDKMTLAFAKIGIAWQALQEMWTDYTISDDLYDKLVTSGMEPIVTGIMMVVMRLREVWKGVTQGFQEGFEIINSLIRSIVAPAFTWLHDTVLIPVANALLSFGDSIGLFADVTISKLDPAMNKWESLGETIGKALAFGTAILLVAKIISIVSTVASAIGTVVGFISSIGSVIGPVIGVVVSVFSAIAGVIGNIVFAVQAVAGGAATVVEALAFIGGGPVAWIIAALVAIGTIAYFIIKDWEGVKGFFVNLGKGIMDMFNTVGEYIGGFVQTIRDKFVFVDVILTFASELLSGIGSIVGTFISWIGEIISHIIDDFVGPIWESIKNLWDRVTESTSEAWGRITDVFNTVKDAIMDTFTPIKDSATEFGDVLYNFFSMVAVGLYSIFSPILSVMVPIIEGAISIIIGHLTIWFDFISMIFGLVFNTVVNILGAVWEFVTSTFATIVEVIGGVFMGLWGIVSGALQVVFGVVVAIFGAIVSYIQGDTEAAKQYLISGWEMIKTGLTSIAMGIWEAIKSVFLGIWNTIVSIGVLILEAIKSPFIGAKAYIDNFISDMAGVGERIMSTIAGGITRAKDKVKGALTDAFEWAKSLLPQSDAKEGPFSMLTYSGRMIPGTMAEGVAKGAKGLYDEISSVSGRAMDKFQSEISSNKPTLDFDSDIKYSVASDDLALDGISRIKLDSAKLPDDYVSDAKSEIDNTYDNTRNIENFNKTEDRKVVLQIAEGAFQFSFGDGVDRNDIEGYMPDIEAILESKLIDIVREMKENNYEG